MHQLLQVATPIGVRCTSYIIPKPMLSIGLLKPNINCMALAVDILSKIPK